MRQYIPSQRWALPTDSLWDIYGDFYDSWLDENYVFVAKKILWFEMEYEEAVESEDLRDAYLDIMIAQAAEARAERLMEDY